MAVERLLGQFFPTDLTRLSTWVTSAIWTAARLRRALSLLSPLSSRCASLDRRLWIFRFYNFAQGLMFYVLYRWIHSLHSWRINMDILRPRRFLCCASKDRKWSSWLLIGWGEKEVMVWYERNRDAHKLRETVMLTPSSVNLIVVSSPCFFELILSIFFLLAAVKPSHCVCVCVHAWRHI